MRLYPISPLNLNNQNSQILRTESLQAIPVQEGITNKNIAKILAGYNGVALAKNVAFGSKQKFIQQGVGELILKITDLAKEAASVQVKITSLAEGSKNTPVQSFVSSSKRAQDGTFNIPILAIDRKNNSYLKSIMAGTAIFFDAKGDVIKKTEANTEYKPSEEFAKLTPEKFTINGCERFSDFKVVSNADVCGIYKEFDNFEDVKNYRGTKPICAILTTDSAFSGLIAESIEDDFKLPANIVGVVAHKRAGMKDFFFNCLSHAKCRMEGRQALVLAGDEIFDLIQSTYQDGKSIVKLNSHAGDFRLTKVDELPKLSHGITIAPAKIKYGFLPPSHKNFQREAVGDKAFNLGELQKGEKEGGYITPKFFAITTGEFDKLYKANAHLFGEEGKVTKLMKQADEAYLKGESYDEILKEADKTIKEEIVFPKSFQRRFFTAIEENLGIKLPDKYDGKNSTKRIAIRSSVPQLEDKDIVPTQGMFSSYIGIKDKEEALDGIRDFVASYYRKVAYMARKECNIPDDIIKLAAVCQECIVDGDYIGTMHIFEDKGVLDAMQGVSRMDNVFGDPYGFEEDFSTGICKRTMLANKQRKATAETIDVKDNIGGKYSAVDCSKDVFNLSREEYSPTVKKIFDKGRFVFKQNGNRPQDVEYILRQIKDDAGKVIGNEVILTQNRDIPLVNN